MNPTMTATDIEIYVADLSLSAAQVWLESVFTQITPTPKRKGMPKLAHPFTTQWQDETFTVVIFENVIAGYTSIWFDHATLPWTDDLACAVVAAKELDKNVRVTAGGWDPRQDPDAWVEIAPNGEQTELIWKT